MTWPFMLKATHRREVSRLMLDFARNTAALEAALRARGGLGTPPPGPQVIGLTLERLVHCLGNAAAMQAAAGRPVFQLMALRGDAAGETGALLAVVGGRMSDADMRRFKAFMCGLAQDIAPGERLATVCDELGKEEGDHE